VTAEFFSAKDSSQQSSCHWSTADADNCTDSHPGSGNSRKKTDLITGGKYCGPEDQGPVPVAQVTRFMTAQGQNKKGDPANQKTQATDYLWVKADGGKGLSRAGRSPEQSGSKDKSDTAGQVFMHFVQTLHTVLILSFFLTDFSFLRPWLFHIHR
jgi:hypothetical protein